MCSRDVLPVREPGWLAASPSSWGMAAGALGLVAVPRHLHCSGSHLGAIRG